MHKKLLISLSLLTMMLLAGVSMAAETVNINKASAAAIQQNLVGIGPIKAEAIVNYRKKNGKFKSLDDLQNVTGLGPALIKKNKRYLSTTKGVVSGDDKAYAAAKKQAGKSKTATKKKSTKKQTTTSAAKKSNKSKAQSKTTAKTAKTVKKNCSGSTSTMSKAEKKACANKKAKKAAKKPAKKKTTKKKKNQPAS